MRQGNPITAIAQSADQQKEGHMPKIVNCECGEVVRAENEDELVQKVGDHVTEKHPDLVGKLSREDVLAMAEEV